MTEFTTHFQNHIAFKSLDDFQWNQNLVQLIPVSWMITYSCIPLGEEGNIVHVAFHDDSFLEHVEELELFLGKRIQPVRAPKDKIEACLKESETSQQVLNEATSGFKPQYSQNYEEEEVLDANRLMDGQSPLVRLVDTLIYSALERRASDIHIETQSRQVKVKYRIDGVLYDAMEPLDKSHHSTVISRVKVMAQLDIAEKRIPQDGRFKLQIHGRPIDFRVSIMPTIHGEDAVIRILDKESTNESFKELNLEILGFEGHLHRQLSKSITEPYGMVLVTGPTGSGKTTTLYACVSEIKNDEDKIVTIEDPVEYQLSGITQIPVHEKKGLTFARGLRSILRHDPDKILVGEIRDTETAQIAIQSALTGHLVFTTVHANNVLDVMGRFVNMGVDLHNFVSALNCIVAQRLVRLICDSCKKPDQPEAALIRRSGLDWEHWKNVVFYKGSGCLSCNGTGYRGRTVIAELLILTDDLREAIKDRLPVREIKRLAAETGMVFLREAALEKLKQGVTTLHEINKVTFIE